MKNVQRVSFLWNPSENMNSTTIELGDVWSGAKVTSIEAGWITELGGWVTYTKDDGTTTEIRVPHLQSIRYLEESS